MAKLKRPQHSLSQDFSKESCVITIASILLKFLKVKDDIQSNLSMRE